MSEIRFFDTALPSPITQLAVSLASQRGDNWWASGTAVIVAPFLAMTAKHVVEDHWERQQGPWPVVGEAHGDFGLIAFQVIDTSANVWHVRRIWNCPHTDISFLKLVPRSSVEASHKWKWPTLNALPPKVGSKVTAFGYHSSEISAGPPVDWRHRAGTSHGIVTAVHVRRRDSVQMPFPCFETDAQIEGGMSGGPVFNEQGQICGLTCSSFPAHEPGEPHTSFVTTLWPAFGAILDLDRKGKPPSRYPALELASGGEIVLKNFDRIGVQWDGLNNTSMTLNDPDS